MFSVSVLTGSILSLKHGRMHKIWAWIGIAIAAFSVVYGLMEALQFWQWQVFGLLSGFLALFSFFVLLPVYYAWLGLSLGRLSEGGEGKALLGGGIDDSNL